MSLESERKELAKLGEDYLPKDFSKAQTLLDSKKSLEDQLKNLPYTNNPADGSLYWEILNKIVGVEGQLDALREDPKDYLADHGEAPMHLDIAMIEALISALKQYEKHLEKPMNSNLKNFILLPGPGHERIHGDIEGMTLLNRLGEEAPSAAPGESKPGFTQVLEKELTKKLPEERKVAEEKKKEKEEKLFPVSGLPGSLDGGELAPASAMRSFNRGRCPKAKVNP